MAKIDPNDIDQLLPQTQCGLCGYGGCLPYAEAMAGGEAPINKCPPGGVSTLKKLADLLNQDPAPFLEDMAEQQKPAQVVIIREEECIGCTKCIQACPVDAIMGAAKQMHTVLPNDCTGCELCIPKCPVDCIDIVSIPEPTETQKQANAKRWREKYWQRKARIKRLIAEHRAKHQQQKQIQTDEQKTIATRQAYIQQALERVKKKHEHTDD